MAGQVKRRKTAQERQADEAAKRARTAGTAPNEPWALETRQPWADKEVAAARPTEEQMEWLEKEGFLKKDEPAGVEGEARPRLLLIGRGPAWLCPCAASLFLLSPLASAPGALSYGSGPRAHAPPLVLLSHCRLGSLPRRACLYGA